PAPSTPVVSAPAAPVTATRPTARPAPAQLGGGGVAENVSSVRYRERASLSYPVSALRQKIGGTVVLLVEIDTTGHATSVTVRQSSGQPDLNAAAIRCARQSTYEPYRVNGIARPCRVEAPFEFKAPRQ
ncbi:MAG: energy transducer TonB, partial [Verrucomicrobiaceae bacterium]